MGTNEQMTFFEETEMDNYDKVIAAIPYWKPTKAIRLFGISAIQSIVKCGLLEAIEIRDRLEYEGALPKAKW